MKKILFGILSLMFLSGCLNHQKYSLSFNYETGLIEKKYYDIRSQKGGKEKDYSLENDWELLKSKISKEFGSEYNADVIKPVKAEIYEENGVLCGKETFQVQLPKAFPSKSAIFEKIHGDNTQELDFKLINGEIYLFCGSKEVESTNGEILKTDKNNIVVWPEEQTVFEFTVNNNNIGGESLLPFYRKEKELNPAK
ncbi:MAG: hypothetical protein ACD_79C01355G0004 [uncultured bacterium]|nr:MAG: hypothetical protein ACD_79C01355G0004 [uncultured bacterium]